MRGVTLRFSQLGGTAFSVLAAPRNREGRKEDPSILEEGFEGSPAGHYRAIDKFRTGFVFCRRI
jgi:hypothetical protein